MGSEWRTYIVAGSIFATERCVAMTRKIYRLGAVIMLAVLFCMDVSSCATRPLVSAEFVLDAMRGSDGGGVSGILRTRSASPDEPDYLTDALLAALYGEAARGWLGDGVDAAPLVNDAALLLPASKHPYELAVFRCSDARGTTNAAAVCRARLDAIRNTWQGSAWTNELDGAIVAIEREYVLLIVAPDANTVLETARRTIRGQGQLHWLK